MTWEEISKELFEKKTGKRFQIDDDGDITEFKSDGNWIDCWEYANGKHWENLCGKLNQLYEENEQLQARNDRQAKQLDDLYRLIEQKDWRTLTDIMDDFKKAEEQLQREWRIWND